MHMWEKNFGDIINYLVSVNDKGKLMEEIVNKGECEFWVG